jgi:hypothetical protein
MVDWKSFEVLGDKLLVCCGNVLPTSLVQRVKAKTAAGNANKRFTQERTIKNNKKPEPGG